MKVKARDNTLNLKMKLCIKGKKIGNCTIPLPKHIITDIRRERLEESLLQYTYTVYYNEGSYLIELNPYQNFLFLWGVRKNWLQKEENIRYLISILFLILGVYISLKQINLC